VTDEVGGGGGFISSSPANINHNSNMLTWMRTGSQRVLDATKSVTHLTGGNGEVLSPFAFPTGKRDFFSLLGFEKLFN
jgi:hypothetical protein